MDIKKILKTYDTSDISIAALGSHSALEVCRGAKDLGFKTLVVAQKGRDETYSRYFATRGSLGCVDECLVLDRFTQVLNEDVQRRLREQNVIFVPHRSFEVYLNSDYNAIEKKFKIPVFGNRYLLKIEERGTKPNQYDVLKKAGIRRPKIFTSPRKIDRLCLVKILEKERGFERAFFLVSSYNEYKSIVREKVERGVFGRAQLKTAVIEEFVAGVHVNFNFFYSPISDRLELLGTDTRRQTNLDGILRIPSSYQADVTHKLGIKYEEAGHIAVTILESMLEDVFSLGERFVQASQELFPPGVIGPFALQSIILPGPPKKEIVVVDVSPRVPGSPGIATTPYSGYLFGESVSVGKRIAREVREAQALNSLHSVVT